MNYSNVSRYVYSKWKYYPPGDQHIPSQDTFEDDVPFPNAFSGDFLMIFQIVAICSWNMYLRGISPGWCRIGPASISGMTCCDLNVVQKHVIWFGLIKWLTSNGRICNVTALLWAKRQGNRFVHACVKSEWRVFWSQNWMQLLPIILLSRDMATTKHFM